MTKIAPVMRSDYNTYQDWKRRNQVATEETIDGVLYYAINVDHERRFGGRRGAVAHFIEVQRYKTVPPKVAGR